MEGIETLRTSQHARRRGSEKGSERRERNVDRRLTTAAQGAADVIHERTLGLVLNILRDILESAVHDVRRERVGF